jgi:serpin B
MRSETFEKALRVWLNEQTGGLLSDQIEGITFSPETILALATTVYFQASWEENFQKESTKKAMFHGIGGDTEAEFMHQRYSSLYYRGEDFSAVSKNLEAGEKMWFILPDEGLSVNDLLQDDEVLSFIGNTYAWSDQRETAIQLAVPKFTVSSKLDLKEPLENLGVTDCFEAYRADFSPLLAEKAFVGKIEHGAFVGIDEEGVTAAAYTFTQMYGTGPSENTVNFTVDRPFLFVITGVDGSVMFIGVVNQV